MPKPTTKMTIRIEKNDGTVVERIFEGSSYIGFLLEEAGILDDEIEQVLEYNKLS